MTKRVDENYNTRFTLENGLKVIAFVPLLARMSGSSTAGLFISQLLFWWGKGEDEEWIYKTIVEIREETALTRHQQDAAIKIWKKLRILDVMVRGCPPRRYFKIDVDLLNTMTLKYVSNLPESAKRFALKDSSKSHSGQNLYQEKTTRKKQQETPSYRGARTGASSGTLDIEIPEIPDLSAGAKDLSLRGQSWLDDIPDI